MVDAAEIKARFPEFADLDEALITRWIDEANRSHSAKQWGGKSDDGLAYLTAHLLVSIGGAGDPVIDGGAPGPIVSERVGDVSATWKVTDDFSDTDLGSTSYGRRYLSLLKTLFVCRCT